jgi:hypothetical protein
MGCGKKAILPQEKCVKITTKNNKKVLESKRYITLQYEDQVGKNVQVAGSFNDWKENKVLIDKENTGVYRCQLRLVPGVYQYKFLVDGQWLLDPTNNDFVPNEFGSLNSMLKVEKR